MLVLPHVVLSMGSCLRFEQNILYALLEDKPDAMYRTLSALIQSSNKKQMSPVVFHLPLHPTNINLASPLAEREYMKVLVIIVMYMPDMSHYLYLVMCHDAIIMFIL